MEFDIVNKTVHHLPFSSSESAKNAISSWLGKINRNDLSTPQGLSKSSTHRVRTAGLESVLIRRLARAWSSSTAIAFRRSMVAVARFVTSLNATRLAPMTRSWRRLHDCRRLSTAGLDYYYRLDSLCSHRHFASKSPQNKSPYARPHVAYLSNIRLSSAGGAPVVHQTVEGIGIFSRQAPRLEGSRPCSRPQSFDRSMDTSCQTPEYRSAGRCP
jgi:hypothetical protein